MVDKIDAFYDFVLQKKMKIVYAIGNRPWENRDFTISDPNGNEITFSQLLLV